jgi:hypothetical protein
MTKEEFLIEVDRIYDQFEESPQHEFDRAEFEVLISNLILDYKGWKDSKWDY